MAAPLRCSRLVRQLHDGAKAKPNVDAGEDKWGRLRSLVTGSPAERPAKQKKAKPPAAKAEESSTGTGTMQKKGKTAPAKAEESSTGRMWSKLQAVIASGIDKDKVKGAAPEGANEQSSAVARDEDEKRVEENVEQVICVPLLHASVTDKLPSASHRKDVTAPARKHRAVATDEKQNNLSKQEAVGSENEKPEGVVRDRKRATENKRRKQDNVELGTSKHGSETRPRPKTQLVELHRKSRPRDDSETGRDSQQEPKPPEVAHKRKSRQLSDRSEAGLKTELKKTSRQPRDGSGLETEQRRKFRQPRDGSEAGLGTEQRRKSRQPRDGSEAGLKTQRQPRDGSEAGLGTEQRRKSRQPRDGSEAGLKTQRQPRDGSETGLKTQRQPRDGSEAGLKTQRQPRDGSEAGLKTQRKSREPRDGSESRLEAQLVELNISLEGYRDRMKFLKECSKNRDIVGGREVHARLCEEGRDWHPSFGNAVVGMYGQCGDVYNAWEAFIKIRDKTNESWLCMLEALACTRRNRSAIDLFRDLKSRHIEVPSGTLLKIMDACAQVGDIEAAREVHSAAVDSGLFASHVVIGTLLIRMYTRCLSFEDAEKTLEEMPRTNVVTWTQLISAYAQAGNGKQALVLHRKMDLEGVKPDRATFATVLDACSSEEAFSYGQLVHRRVLHTGWEKDVVVGTALVDMYGACGNLGKATQVFHVIQSKNAVAWTALIFAYCRRGYTLEVLRLFEYMQLEGIRPNALTHEAAIDACACLTALGYGKKIHEQVLESGVQTGRLDNTLVEFYGKCEELDLAASIFSDIRFKSPARCSTFVMALAQHGRLEKAAAALWSVNLEGNSPDGRAFEGLLSACSSRSLLKEAKNYFQSMTSDYGLVPTVEHYKPLISLFGRRGRLSKMQDLLYNMPWRSDFSDWLTLLVACEDQRDLKRGRIAFKNMKRLDNKNHVPYELLARIYIDEEKWDEAQDMVKKMNMTKARDWSHVEVHGKVYRFIEGDTGSADYEKLDSFVERMNFKMKGAGYVFKKARLLKAPTFSPLLVREPRQETRHHSERLAAAFGILKLMSSSSTQELRISCDHRMCFDCHMAMKYSSMVFAKRIVLKDARRFHHFQDGVCSCKDCW